MLDPNFQTSRSRFRVCLNEENHDFEERAKCDGDHEGLASFYQKGPSSKLRIYFLLKIIKFFVKKENAIFVKKYRNFVDIAIFR